MLTKRQLKDAFNCWFGSCEKCSCNGLQREHGTFDCMVETIKTALAYREMLERMEWSNRIPLMNILPVYEHRCPLCGWHEFNGHAPNCELAALLKESEVEEDA